MRPRNKFGMRSLVLTGSVLALAALTMAQEWHPAFDDAGEIKEADRRSRRQDRPSIFISHNLVGHSDLIFVVFRATSWIVLFLSAKETIHEITRTNTENEIGNDQ